MFLKDYIASKISAQLYSVYTLFNEAKIENEEIKKWLCNTKVIDIRDFQNLKSINITDLENSIPKLIETENLGSSSKNQGGTEEMPTPLKYGKGSIRERQRKRKNGSIYIYFEGRYYVGSKQKTVTAKSYSGCFKKLSNKRGQYQETKTVIKNKGNIVIFTEWVDEWYNTFKEPFLKPNTKCAYSRRIKTIKEYFGDKPLNSIKYTLIQPFINNASKSMAVFFFNMLNEIFDKALQLGKIKINPMSFMSRPKHTGEKGESISSADQKTILSELTVNVSEVMRFLMCTGLRISEYLALDKSCIHNGYIKISKTYALLANEKNTPKSVKGTRKVPFINSEFDIDAIIPSKLTYAQILNQLKKLKANGLIDEKITIHSTRHTFASLCYKAGIDPKKIQSWLGHESVSTTLDTYTDIFDDTTSPIYHYILSLKEKY